ncbi:MAG TPA: LamG-like jellyroll fold domain-containing protein, partial [Elusimicrobiota bacterium]|nr:LamG-like jellyroll fold domain-containing protein [Elusimicrobiota bacterium]
GSQRILSEQGPAGFWGFGINGTALRLFDSRNTNGVTDLRDVSMGSAVTAGVWHKVDVVRTNGVQERFFVDGNFIGAVTAYSTWSFTNAPISHPVIVGAYEAGSEYFNGAIDEIRVMDSAMTDEQIYLEYQGSNVRQYAAALASPYAHVLTGGFTSPSNGMTSGTYVPSEGITTASAPNQRWIFEAQNTSGVSTISSTFTVTIDQTVPSAPQGFGGVASGASAVTWSWSAPSHICPPPGSGSVFYQLFDAVNGGGALNPPGNMAYPATSVTESGTPNELLSRRLRVTDTWGTSALTASASVYTNAAVPTGLTATNVSTGSFTATWNANGNPSYTRYEVTYTADPNFVVGVSTRVGFSDDYTNTSVGITGLSSGSTYYVRVYSFSGRVSDPFGGARSSSFASMSVVAVPPAPALTGTANSTSRVTWSWTSRSGATGYTLYDSPTQAVLFGPDGAGLTFSSATLSPNTRYDAEVEADLPAPAPPTVRGHAFVYTNANSPTAPSVYAVYSTSAVYAWNPNGNPPDTFYQIIVTTDPAFGVVVSTLSVSTPTAIAAGLIPGVTYYAHVEAISGGQAETGYGATVTAVTAADPSITVNTAPPSPYVAPGGLAGAWQFDEDSGTTTTDGSGNGNSGNFGCTTPACVSTPTFSAGPVGLGSAVSFSGQAGGVVLTNTGAPFNFATSVTVEAWVNPTTAAQPASAGIVGVGRAGSEDFAIDVSSHESFEFLTTAGGVEFKLTVPTATIVAGQWTHVVGVYDSVRSTAALYLNGVAVAVTPVAGARANAHPALSIGNRQDASGNFTLPFAGKIDSVRVIASALTPAQVLADYNGSFISSVAPGGLNAGIIVALPPNAFGAPAQIYVTNDPVNHPIRITAAELNAGLAVTPAGLSLVPGSLVEVVPVVGGVPFTTPLGSSATLTIPYKDPSNSGLISGTNPPLAAAGLQMYTLNTAVNVWTQLPAVVDKNSRSVSGQTPHFSLFALFAPATVASSLSGVKVFPVPWKPGSGSRFDAPGVTFSNLPASGAIRILTLAGKRVRDMAFNGVSAGSAVWDGQNDDGRRAASGVYFARITSQSDGSTVIVKFAIER